MAENHIPNGNSTAEEIRPEDIIPEDIIPEDIIPYRWKLVNTKNAVERYSNPKSWEFKILKMSSFRPTWMKNMFSKYWNTPPMKVDGQKPSGKAQEIKDTCTTEIPLEDTSEGASNEQLDEAVEVDDEKDESPGNLEATRKHSEVLSDDEIQGLKNAPKGQIQILWIGHASLLIQMEGFNILTDPVFSDKAGPKNMVGYTRYRRVAVTVKQLQQSGIEIHAVVISHNHYDHFDKQSVIDLNTHFSEIKWFVPKDLKSDLTSLGCKHVKEAMWWECLPLASSKIKFHFTPAKHWSGRNPTDWYTSLWGSWIIEGETATVFFAGDTGFQGALFTAIKKKFNRITVAALPIGAYEPREMMKCQHINPEEAVKIHNILGAKKSIGIHWRTFQLSCEGIDQPIQDLKVAKEKHKVDKDDFITLEKSLITTINCEEDSAQPQSLLIPD